MSGWRGGLLLLVALAAIAAVAVQPPIAQPLDYHGFADQRRLLGVPNLLNVASNLAFVLVGAWGLARLFGAGALPGVLPPLRAAYLTFFVGAVLIGLGSGYYHLAPDNASLVWDRLPMTLSFMALVAVVIGEHVDPRLGRRLLLPLLLVGVASVLYWAYSESIGRGDLRPYVLVQFLPLLLLPLILLLFPSRLDRARELWLLIALYAVAKAFELADRGLLELGGLVSGHTMKHPVAALAMAMLVLAMTQRRPRAPSPVRPASAVTAESRG